MCVWSGVCLGSLENIRVMWLTSLRAYLKLYSFAVAVSSQRVWCALFGSNNIRNINVCVLMRCECECVASAGACVYVCMYEGMCACVMSVYVCMC